MTKSSMLEDMLLTCKVRVGSPFSTAKEKVEARLFLKLLTVAKLAGDLELFRSKSMNDNWCVLNEDAAEALVEALDDLEG